MLHANLQHATGSAGSEDRTVKIWDTRTRDAQREFESRAPVTTVTLVQGQNELISGDQDGNIRVWDITAGACSCELVPEVDVAVRSVSVALDGSQVQFLKPHVRAWLSAGHWIHKPSG